MIFEGWLLDSYLRGKYATLWFKTVEGGALKVIDRYRPVFLAEPKKSCSPDDLCYLFDRHPLVASTRIVKRYPTLKKRRLKRVVEVKADSIRCLNTVQSYADRLDQVKETYNKGLTPIQWYLIHKQIAPTNLCRVEANGRILKHIKKLDDDAKIEPPPFKTLHFQTEGSRKVKGIKVYDEWRRPIIHLKGLEEELIRDFKKLIFTMDPDILVTSSPSSTTKFIMERANCYGMVFRFGRDGKRYHGRILLGLCTFLDSGIAGLVERARFTFAPMGVSGDWEAGKTIDSVQCSEAVKQKIMVPDMKGGFREALTALELVQRDRGGMVFSPKVGLHENVGCLDFESMFPNIIVNRNLSYETVSREGIDKKIPGFMGSFTEPFLKRRLRFKHLRTKFPHGSKEWWWCQQRQSALKLMLVVIYGYSGCYVNRFANVGVFREINRQARKAMVKALNISLENGFEIVYGDTDSLFTKKPGATEYEYKELASLISKETNLSMGLDRHFKFLVLLNKTTDPDMVAARRYYGKLSNGRLFYRGIELRRRDTPPYIKKMQEEIIKTLLDSDDHAQVLNIQLQKALTLAEEAYNDILSGNVDTRELVISKKLRKDIKEYQSRQPHVVAASLNDGDGSEASYVFVDTERSNPYLRVMPASRINGDHQAYDRRKYAEMVRRAAWNLLRPFKPDESDIGGVILRESRLDIYS